MANSSYPNSDFTDYNKMRFAVVCEGKQMCMMARGVEKRCSDMVTSHVLGVFREDRGTRQEFMSLLNRK